MTLRFKLFGSLEIEDNGRLSPLMKSAKGCALLTYLIVTNQSQTRAHLADLLWEATSTADSLRNLRRLLHTVRKAIPDLTVTRQTLSFQHDTATYIDYQIVRNALDQSNITELDQGLKHYSGNLLATFYLDDAPYFNEWLIVVREQLHSQVMDAYHRLCSNYNEHQTWNAGIDAARRWLQVDDLHEAAYRWLIQFLVANGQLEAAREQYEICAIRLRDELGIEPEESTKQLINQLDVLSATSQSIITTAPKWEAAPLPEPDELSPPGDLPPHTLLPYQRNDDFTGREADLLQLAASLLPWNAQPQASQPRAVAICGMGGLGKTQLAVEFAYRYGRFYEGGVYWISFAQAENVAEEIGAVGGERGMKLFKEADQLAVADQVGRVQQAWQEATPRLLIFDNCEDENLLEQWLPVTGGCRVLITSRRSSWPRGVGIVRRLLDTLSQSESTALLHQLAPETARQAPATIEQIADELGHLPLALHLAGSFLARYTRITPQRYLEQLQQIGLLKHPSLQGRGTNYSPTGHELHVARTFAINQEQLAPDTEINQIARQLLVNAACFSPNETIPRPLLLATMLGTNDEDLMAELLAEDGLEYLLGLGFLQARQNGLVMHPLVAAFVREDLPDEATIYTRLINTVLVLIERQQKATDSLYTLPIPTNQLNFILDRGLNHLTPPVAELANIFGRHLIERHDYERAFVFLEQTLAKNKALLGENAPQTLINLIHLGTVFVKKGHFDTGHTYFQEAIDHLEHSPETHLPELGLAYNRLAEANSKMGDFANALEANQKALEIYEKTFGPDHVETANCLHFRGTIFIESGNFDQAREPYEQAIARLQKLFGYESIGVARIQGNLGWLYLQVGTYLLARDTLEQAFSILENVLGQEHQYTLSVLHSLGQLYYEQGDYERAESILRTGLTLRQKLVGDIHHTTAFMQTDLGLVLRETKRFDEAKTLLEAALATRGQMYGFNHPWTARSHNHLGKLYVELGDYEQAAILLEHAWSFNESYNPEHPNMADSLDYRGDLLARTGQMETANHYWLRSKAIREQTQGPAHPKVAPTLLRLAYWHVDAKDIEKGQELAQTAVSILKFIVQPQHVTLQEAQELLAALA